MLTDEQLRDREANVADRIEDLTGMAGMNFCEIMLCLRTLQQQNKQMKEALEGLVKVINLTGYLKPTDEYRIANELVQSIQGGNT